MKGRLVSTIIDGSLIGGERIAYRAYMHPVTYTRAIICALIAAGFFYLASAYPTKPPVAAYVGWGVLAIAGCFALWARIRIQTSEFAVTDRRVIIHVGWLRKTSQELFLAKVEGISVNQSFWGRVLNFGDVSIRGGGGLQEDLSTVASPYQFRRHVELLAAEYSQLR